jgi:hypothetical protein
MSNLLVRSLREAAFDKETGLPLDLADAPETSVQEVLQAAIEIERLRAELVESTRLHFAAHQRFEMAEAEVEALRSALRMVGMLRQLGGMMPGSREVVQAVIDAADAALRGKEAT